METIEIIRGLREVVRDLRLRITRLRSRSVSRQDVKNDVASVVDAYFADDRRILGGLYQHLTLKISISAIGNCLSAHTHVRSGQNIYLALRRSKSHWQGLS